MFDSHLHKSGHCAISKFCVSRGLNFFEIYTKLLKAPSRSWKSTYRSNMMRVSSQSRCCSLVLLLTYGDTLAGGQLSRHLNIFMNLLDHFGFTEVSPM